MRSRSSIDNCSVQEHLEVFPGWVISLRENSSKQPKVHLKSAGINNEMFTLIYIATNSLFGRLFSTCEVIAKTRTSIFSKHWPFPSNNKSGIHLFLEMFCLISLCVFANFFNNATVKFFA